MWPLLHPGGAGGTGGAGGGARPDGDQRRGLRERGVRRPPPPAHRRPGGHGRAHPDPGQRQQAAEPHGVARGLGAGARAVHGRRAHAARCHQLLRAHPAAARRGRRPAGGGRGLRGPAGHDRGQRGGAGRGPAGGGFRGVPRGRRALPHCRHLPSGPGRAGGHPAAAGAGGCARRRSAQHDLLRGRGRRGRGGRGGPAAGAVRAVQGAGDRRGGRGEDTAVSAGPPSSFLRAGGGLVVVICGRRRWRDGNHLLL
mmetsp:Transcript_47166/g.81130  ORF Transcript_47166/g.81130 Transcript_47166/m.81130 type:complete len:254 (+) Transcript_47166:339-1100(+)